MTDTPGLAYAFPLVGTDTLAHTPVDPLNTLVLLLHFGAMAGPGKAAARETGTS